MSSDIPTGSMHGSVAFITGGGRGIGRALALILAERGASLALVARSEDELNRTADEIRSRGGLALPLVADVTDADQMEEAVRRAVSDLGRLDAVVVNAGVAQPMEALWNCDPQEWLHSVSINLFGAFTTCRAALPVMLKQGSGRIIFVSSGTGGPTVIPGWSAYSSAKAGLNQLMRVLAAEVRDKGITAAAIYPGIPIPA
jgi:NAD(P)-dependent dehydrogenase (short-subunit alcohol dehydrogenase family)